MKTKDMKSGISLIVLIITIIVVIILAAVVILTLSKNNPVESAKEARFKEDVRTFQDELALYISKQYANAGGHWDGVVSATSFNDIVIFIPSFTKKYEGKFVINNNNLEYTNKLDEKEKEFAQNLNVNKKNSMLPDEYQQVEYIESTGTQYINTNVSADDGYRVEFTGLTLFPVTGVFNNYRGIVGADGITNDASGNKYEHRNYFIYSSSYLNIGYGTYSYWNINNYLNVEMKVSVSTIKGNVFLSINGNKILDKNYQGLRTYENLYLFSCNIAYSGENHPGNVRIKETKIYTSVDDSEFVRDFIPCYSTIAVTDVTGKECPKGTIGMYDKLEGKFYTNQGTGEFIAGPDVN